MFLVLGPVLISSVGCSEGEPFVAGGVPAGIGNFSFVILLRTVGIRGMLCSGTVIHPEWILTAAHCVEQGCRGLVAETSKTYDNHTQIRYGERCIQYPGYYQPWSSPKPRSRNDYALIKLKEAFVVDNKVVGLASLEDNIWKDGQMRRCVVVGYGKTRSGSYGQLYSSSVIVGHGHGTCPCITKPYNLERFLCLRPTEQGSSAPCPGDSGGPLVCDNLQTGVASHLIPTFKCDLLSRRSLNEVSICGNEGMSAVYLYICPVLGWIRKHVGDSIPKQPNSC